MSDNGCDHLIGVKLEYLKNTNDFKYKPFLRWIQKEDMKELLCISPEKHTMVFAYCPMCGASND